MDSNPTFVVLGATGGIGSDLCRRLLSAGANVVGAGRNPEKVRALADSCGLRPYTLDASDVGQVIACVSEARQTFGRVDGVANCVGSLLLKPAHLTSESDWQATLTTNLTTAFATVHAGVKSMMETGGSIVLVSSVAARIGLANHEAIAAAKAGIIGLTLAAAASYAQRGIRVNCVAPGLVRTPLTARLTATEAALKVSAADASAGPHRRARRCRRGDRVASRSSTELDHGAGLGHRWRLGDNPGTDNESRQIACSTCPTRRLLMDTFENASPPQEQPEMVVAECWECGETKLCHEYIVCCTGTHFHTCSECRKRIERMVS